MMKPAQEETNALHSRSMEAAYLLGSVIRAGMTASVIDVVGYIVLWGSTTTSLYAGSGYRSWKSEVTQLVSPVAFPLVRALPNKSAMVGMID